MLFRPDPLMPAHAYRTFSVSSPISTHTRPATCREVDCQAHARGWITKVDVGTDLGQRQANYIRLHSGRSFTVTEVGTLVTFTFPPGQKCFAEHRVSLERPEFYRVRGGDWRGNPRGESRDFTGHPEDWVDMFANHQQRIADEIQKG